MAKHDLGDMQKIKRELEGWLAARLPGGRGLILDDLEFPEESGESSVTLLLNAHFGGGSERLVCRMVPPLSEVFDSHDLHLQYRLMEIAAQAGVPTPGLLGYEPDSALLGSDFYIMRFVDGQIPTDNPPYAFGSWVTELSDQQRARMWRNGIAEMARIHQIDMTAHDLPSLPRARLDQPPMQHELDKFTAMLTDGFRERLPAELLEAFAWLCDKVPADGPRRLCWGDSRPGNVIWRDLAPVAIIDWEMASLGDPMADISWWFWIDHVNSVGLGVEMLGGLPQLDEVYTQWEAATGLSTVNRHYYDLLSVVRYAIILEKKFQAMEAAGLGTIENFAMPFVTRQREICRNS